MRWLELCAVWCCGGWKSGSPRFSQLAGEGARIFAEALASDEKRLSFRRSLLEILWARRDNAALLSGWLTDVRDELIDGLSAECRTLNEEAEILAAFIERTSATGDVDDMTLGQFSGQGMGVDRINLSTLHSAKGREFTVVVLFAMDQGRIPWNNVTPRQVLESRRLFYVGFTRAKSELHMVYTENRASPFVTEVQNRLAG
jgi:superfamily I DNA/RNA helicase